ncbi:Mid2-like cell wall stress sensor domain protein [Staphylococcus pseudoxylosus]|uniref:Mid2-like cell wall stress sensor domain protein n=1 Tax=Staphylococcus pseudoxylosus TaxID=2282419 RepID=A0AAQ0MF24_9STAP|nr:Mid2-like cell wall stress sensor domain protein [Staphylococcus pseudoxylosus]RQM86677.1 Mid2-like cell wall stress sensor domain protein [Staphylococcus xylosus]MCE5002109.1 Mid2-like cell wall stress sensor domain protein [Staphylococcus pseudoxylosus]MDW8546750.1 Mid2-like cell wall stress sensor domain protein [Staphylococcus pseudoxylosus]MEB5783671.1 Mid2-like cell wall stress sensor domain protein [Staphylococcus pseudoxylosus]RMI84745.1 Mid2-like cell wall stress sensor domain prot
MGGIWFVFGITVLIAVYSGITFFTNVNNKAKQKTQNEQSAKKNNIYGVVFLVFLIIAIIELFVYIA